MEAGRETGTWVTRLALRKATCVKRAKTWPLGGALVTRRRVRPNPMLCVADKGVPDQGVIDFSLGFINSTTSSNSATVVATL